MAGKIRKWINERWPLDALIRLGLEEEMAGGTSYAYVFGSSVFILFLLQGITGTWQLLYFVPITHRAYDSLNYMRLEVAFGWLVHGLHYWGASAMVIVIGLHMSQAFIWGAYKDPRQITWLAGVGQLLLTLTLAFSGPVLPWDEKGYWEAEVGTSMAGTVPYVGSITTNLLRGGGALGQLTLSRFFFLHIAVLPVLLIILIAIHLISFRQTGISGPWNRERRRSIGYFWPDQLFKDALVIAVIFVILVGLCAFVPAPFSGPLDTMQTFYTPKPEWYFLFLYQTLKAFHGNLEPVGTVGIPLLIVLLLIFLPFIDRSPERNPARRPVTMACYLIFVGWVITMAFAGYYSKPGVGNGGRSPSPLKPAAKDGGILSRAYGETISKSSENVKKGDQLFNTLGCIGCHRIQGKGGVIGPELSPEVLRGKSRDWLIAQIRDPKAHNPSTAMPAFTPVTNQQVNDIIDFILSAAKEGPPTPPLQAAERGKPSITQPIVKKSPEESPGLAAFTIGNVELGQYLFSQNCTSCHGPQGKDQVPNPGSTAGKVPVLNPVSQTLFSKDPQVFTDDIDRFIQHGSVPPGPNPALRMLPFGDSNSLTQQMIANIEAYVLYLNGVNRATILHPGIKPHLFFLLTVAFFGLGLGGFWLWKGRRKDPKFKGGGSTSKKVVAWNRDAPAPETKGVSFVVEPARRNFLKLFVWVISSLVAVVLVVPLIGSIIGPSFRKKALSWTEVGDIGPLSEEEPHSFGFSYKKEDAYLRETVIHSIWVVKHSASSVTVFSPICPHLGCRYDWNPEAKKFICPCHGSFYSIDGKVLGGPAPRPLDTLPWKLENGQLFVEWEQFKVGIPQKVRI